MSKTPTERYTPVTPEHLQKMEADAIEYLALVRGYRKIADSTDAAIRDVMPIKGMTQVLSAAERWLTKAREFRGKFENWKDQQAKAVTPVKVEHAKGKKKNG